MLIKKKEDKKTEEDYLQIMTGNGGVSIGRDATYSCLWFFFST